jgi:hypothetical protein
MNRAFELRRFCAELVRGILDPEEPGENGPTDEQLKAKALEMRLFHFQPTAGDPVLYEITEGQLFAYARLVLEAHGGTRL